VLADMAGILACTAIIRISHLLLIGSGMLFKAQCCLIPPWQDEHDWEGNFWCPGARAHHVDPVSWGMPSGARAVSHSPQVMGTSSSLSDLSEGP